MKFILFLFVLAIAGAVGVWSIASIPNKTTFWKYVLIDSLVIALYSYLWSNYARVITGHDEYGLGLILGYIVMLVCHSFLGFIVLRVKLNRVKKDPLALRTIPSPGEESALQRIGSCWGLVRNTTSMKIAALLLFVLSLTGCRKSDVDQDEVKATILNYSVGFVACSGGYTLQLENDALYRTFTLPEPYNDFTKVTFPASVWMRYKNAAGSCGQSAGLIEVTAIRPE